MPNFSCSLTRNITSHSMRNLGFHSLLRLGDDYTANSHYLTIYISLQKVGRMYFLNLGVKGLNLSVWLLASQVNRGPFSCKQSSTGRITPAWHSSSTPRRKTTSSSTKAVAGEELWYGNEPGAILHSTRRISEHALNSRPPSWIGEPRKPGMSTTERPRLWDLYPLNSHEPKWRLRQSDEFIRYPPKTPALQASIGISR